MCSANQWECALLLGESHAHGARGKPYFSPVTPFRPACLRRHRNVLPNSCAMCFEISGAHGSHCPLCPSPYLSVLFRTHPYRHCSQYRLCAMHTANRRECALFSGERTAHGARGKPYFSPVTPFRPACYTEACGTQCGFFTVRGARPTACGDGAA